MTCAKTWSVAVIMWAHLEMRYISVNITISQNAESVDSADLVILENTRCVIYVTYLSMDGNRDSLAFHPYPTFVVLTTSMDTIPKTVSVVILK